MTSSGEIAIATAGPGWTAVLTTREGEKTLTLVNEGPIAGFVRIGAAGPSFRLPAGPCSRSFDISGIGRDLAVSIKRDGGSDMSGVYGDSM